MARMDANQRRHTERCAVAGVASKRGYARHRPEDTVLYQVVERHAGSFFDSLSEQGASLPGFVREEFDAYLRCGRLEHGFVRAKCEGCRHEYLIPFSCRKRGFCPSCGARRMVDDCMDAGGRVKQEPEPRARPTWLTMYCPGFPYANGWCRFPGRCAWCSPRGPSG